MNTKKEMNKQNSITKENAKNDKKFEVISNNYYSNCLIEAVKAKLKNWKHVKIICVSPFDNESFCPHFLWSDGEYDYDFCNIRDDRPMIVYWTLHKGNIRRRELGYGERFKAACKEWTSRHKKKWGLNLIFSYEIFLLFMV